jgi:hypothetical protein
MKRSESEALGFRIVHFFLNDGQQDIKLTCRHFMAEGVARTTIKDHITRYKERGTTSWKKQTGRPRTVATAKVVHAVDKLINKDPSISERTGAAKMGLTKTTYRRIKVEDLSIKTYKKEPAPKYKGDQQERAKSACRKIYRNQLLSDEPKVLIIDDETYVPMARDQVPGPEYYQCRTRESVSDANRFKPQEKFCKKFLVWQAMDELGNVSEPFISTGTITGEVYLNECLKKRLLPFIHQHHKKRKILFWPDMASCHYKKEVIEWLKAEKIEFVAKDQNAPNVPQARPIEKFWALFKAAYKRRKQDAKSLKSFKCIWKKIAADVASKSAQKLMKGARRNLRATGYKNVFAPYKVAHK